MMECAGALQGVMPLLRGSDTHMQSMAVESMLKLAFEEAHFDAIKAAGICAVGMSCYAEPLCKL